MWLFRSMHNTLILAWTFHCFCPAVLILCSSKCIFQTDFIKYGFLLKCKHVKAENVTEFSYTIDKSIGLTHTHPTLLYYTHPDIQPYHIHTHIHLYHTNIHTHSPSPTHTTHTFDTLIPHPYTHTPHHCILQPFRYFNISSIFSPKYFYFYFNYFYGFQDRVWLCSSGGLGTHSVHQADPELQRDLLNSGIKCVLHHHPASFLNWKIH